MHNVSVKNTHLALGRMTAAVTLEHVMTTVTRDTKMHNTQHTEHESTSRQIPLLAVCSQITYCAQ